MTSPQQDDSEQSYDELGKVLTQFCTSFSCENIKCAVKSHKPCAEEAKQAIHYYAQKMVLEELKSWIPLAKQQGDLFAGDWMWNKHLTDRIAKLQAQLQLMEEE